MNIQEHIANTGPAHCAGIHELIDWQVIQYRQAVDEHRLSLSTEKGRCVAWQEAERDFPETRRASLNEKWRIEYCGAVCPFHEQCLLALHFLHSRKTEPLHKAV